MYHYQVLSQDAQSNQAASGDNTFTTSAAGTQTVLQIQGNASEVSGVTNGSTVTPATAPSGFTGTVVANGTGSVNFAPAQTGNGVYFLNCCGNTNNAYYQFTGSTIGNIFNVSQGQISFYLESRYSFAQRQSNAASPRYAFDVRDGNGNHLFYFLTQVTSGRLSFTYAGWRSSPILLCAARYGKYAVRQRRDLTSDAELGWQLVESVPEQHAGEVLGQHAR